MAEKAERTPVYTLARGLAFLLFNTICPVKYDHPERARALQAPAIIISNHLSAMDPILVAYAVKKYEIRFIGKRELAGSKLTDKLLSRLHMIPVTRGGTDMGAMRASLQTLKDGHILGIFPEGTRHQPDLMQTVESGAAMIALRADVPVLPVYIERKFGFFRITRVHIGEIMDLSDLKQQGLSSDTISQLCSRIRELYHGMRKAAIRNS